MTEEEKKNLMAANNSPQTVVSKKEQSLIEEEEPPIEKKKEVVPTNYEFEADWERIFVANIESAKTLPYISLLKFKFIEVNFQRSDSEREPDRESEIKKTASSKLYARYFKAIFGEDIKARRRKKIEDIFNVDEGPSNYDYNLQLGLEFWSRYCNIDKNTLKQSVSGGFWDRRESSYKDLKEKMKQIMNEKKGLLSRLWNSFESPTVFLKGKYEPVRAPQRVISPEERFRVVSLANIKRASDDIIPPKEYKTITDTFEKLILRVYKWVVDLLGGKWPRIRKPTLEEMYDDVLIWILDVQQSKERILAILNDRIKKEII